MKKINQISALLFFVLALTFTGCSVSGKSGRGCGCPGVNKKSVG
jgi:hypothetical protein